MNRDDIYNDLVVQYDNLSLIEKQAIMIYKSRLYNLFNSITSITDFLSLNSGQIIERLDNREKLEEDIINFRNILNKPENMVVKYSIFNLIDLNSFNNLVDDLKYIYIILKSARNKLFLNDDLTVYRAVSLNNLDNINGIARGNVISTSIKIDDTLPFLGNGNNDVLYVINVKKGANVLVSPYTLVKTYENEDDYLEKKLNNTSPSLLKVMSRGKKGQQEVILFNDDFMLENIKSEEKIINGRSTLVCYLNAIKNENEKKSFLAK